jgi:hypothetical protein
VIWIINTWSVDVLLIFSCSTYARRKFASNGTNLDPKIPLQADFGVYDVWQPIRIT